jgi:hypothetical protein
LSIRRRSRSGLVSCSAELKSASTSEREERVEIHDPTTSPPKHPPPHLSIPASNLGKPSIRPFVHSRIVF